MNQPYLFVARIEAPRRFAHLADKAVLARSEVHAREQLEQRGYVVHFVTQQRTYGAYADVPRYARR